MNQTARQGPLRFQEDAVIAQIAILMVGVTWAFGGNADWVRTPISIWGSVGIVLAALNIGNSRLRSRILRGTLKWIWPVALLNALVGISCLTGGFRNVVFEGQHLMMPVRVDWWIPSAARPELALRALWLFDGIYISCMNLAIVVRSRHLIRILIAIAVGNAFALSGFGVVQKLSNATGIYFGRVKSPQDYFFASFVYDNHWGAYIVLMLGACIGLVVRYARGVRDEGFFRGPAFTGLTAACLLAASVPFSGSRACTVLIAVLIAVGIARGMPRISESLRFSGASPAGIFAGLALASVLAVAGIWVIAGDVIAARAQKTRDQVTTMWSERGLGSRAILYQDTLRMARERILFGWGMGSYPSVFGLFNSQKPNADRLPVIYHDAHSDCLQSFAELGLVGTALLGATVAMPALALRRRKVTPIPYFLLWGCGLVGAYSCVEFPFGNVAVVLCWWFCFLGAIQYARLGDPGPVEHAKS